MSNGNESAYPLSELMHVDFHPNGDKIYKTIYSGGLTKREYFAGLAMQLLCANSIPGNHHSPKELAAEAILYADELLRQLDA